jgi:hypothetical protein
MSGTLGIQRKGDDCACCDPWGEKQRKTPQMEYSEADLAKEMNALSFEQRERIFEDVHGVASVNEETPEFVAKCISALDDAISKIPSKYRTSYNKATFLKPTLQTDRKFKLQLLRAEEFDAKKAAERMVKYFDHKCNLFGEDKLVKRLTLDDLSEDELYLYKIGYMAELPFRDRSGRPIIFGDGTKLDFDRMTIDGIVSDPVDEYVLLLDLSTIAIPILNVSQCLVYVQIRCFWYMMVSCFEDEVAQKKGVCTIMRFSGGRRSISESIELASRTAYSSHCVPGRTTSFHVSYDDPRMDFIINTLRLGVGGAARVRTRAHFGK